MEYGAIQTIDFVKNQDELVSRLRNSISRAVFLNSQHFIDKDHYFEFGITYPEMIIDRASEPILKYISIDSVFTVKAEKDGTGFKVEIPNRSEVYKEFELKKENMIRSAENILVSNVGDHLMKLPKVQNGLNPIKEILVNLFDDNELLIHDIYRRKGPRKGKNYLDFLSALQFVSIDETKVYPGNELTKYELAGATRKEAYEKIILDVLQQGYQFLRDELKIYILTPYLELTNSYYLPSFFANKLLSMNPTDIERHYSDMYKRYKKPLFQIKANLFEMEEAGILKKESEGYKGFEDVFSNFEEAFPAY